MSRLTADQESRGDDGVPGAGEIDSLMRVNLAEGCGTVNAAPWRAEREARDMRDERDLKFEVLGSKFQKPRTVNLEPSPIPPVSFAGLCSCNGFLYKNDCAGH
jgi:hypothetical protein